MIETMGQFFENTESTKCQYALRELAVALDWPSGHRFELHGPVFTSPAF